MNKKNNKRGERFRQPTKVLAFNNQLKLAAVFASYNMAERLTGIPHQMLVRACKGEIIAIKKHYWRELEEDETISTVFESEDFGTYSLLEYDREIGINREIYYNQKMEKGKISPESEYENRSQYIKTFEYKIVMEGLFVSSYCFHLFSVHKHPSMIKLYYRAVLCQYHIIGNDFNYTAPCKIKASATFLNPAILEPTK